MQNLQSIGVVLWQHSRPFHVYGDRRPGPRGLDPLRGVAVWVHEQVTSGGAKPCTVKSGGERGARSPRSGYPTEVFQCTRIQIHPRIDRIGMEKLSAHAVFCAESCNWTPEILG